MKYFLILVLATNIFSQEIEDKDLDKLINIIYKIEGADKTRFPYGIKSVPLKGKTKEARKAYARQICKNTIINNLQRWKDEGCPGEFIGFLGDRYCPPAGSEGNRNWKKNVQFYIKKEKLQLF